MSTVEADRSNKMAGLPRDFDEWVTLQRMEHETDAQWRVREAFFKHYSGEFTRDRLTVLSMCLVNVVFLGSSYEKGLAEQVGSIREKLEAHIAEAMQPDTDKEEVTIIEDTPPIFLRILTDNKKQARIDPQTMSNMMRNPPPQISSTIPSALHHVAQVTRVHSEVHSVARKTTNIVHVPNFGEVDISKPPPPVLVRRMTTTTTTHSSTYAEKLVEGKAVRDSSRDDFVKSLRQKIQTRRSGGDGDKKAADNNTHCAGKKEEEEDGV